MHYPCDEKPDAEEVDHEGHYAVDQQCQEQAHNPPHVPLRLHHVRRSVFLGYRRPGLQYLPVHLRQRAHIVRSAVLEDVCLYLGIAFVGIVVQAFQPLLRELIPAHILLHGILVVLKHTAYVHGQRQADVAVHLGLRTEHHRGHLAQHIYERVIAGNVRVAAVDEVLERHYLLPEVLILLRGLVAGVGKVEHVVVLLRVEHQ